MKCIYCYGEEGEYGKQGLMNFETASRAVDWLINISGNREEVMITFFGGEPLLNFKLIKQAVQYSNERALRANKKMFFSITTNGSYLNDEVIEFLNSNKFSIIISCDGDRKVQKVNRPFKISSLEHKQIEINIKKLLSARKEFKNTSARLTITNNNSDLLIHVNYLKNCGFRKINWAEAIKPNNIPKVQIDYSLSKKDYEKILEYISSLTEETITSIKERKIPADTKIFQHVARLYSKTKRLFFCGLGRGIVGISINGDIFPCHRFVGDEMYKMGNIFNSEELLELPITNEGIGGKLCNECWAKFFCGGGCIHENINTNTLNQNLPLDQRCNIIRKSIEGAIYVYSMLSKEDKDFLGYVNENLDNTDYS